MIDSGDRVVERTFEYLAARDWDGFRSLLATQVERIGPFGEHIVGRDAYVELMAAGDQAASHDDLHRTTWDVHRVVYAQDTRSAFARVTAHVPRDGRKLRIEQTLAYDLDEDGLIARIEVFWRDPRSRPGSRHE
jgi:hypothetical protein